LGLGDQVLSGGEGEVGTANGEDEVLSGLRVEREETGGLISGSASGLGESIEGIGGDVDESGAGVDDGLVGRANGLSVVGNSIDVDAPVLTLEGDIGDASCVLGAINTTEGEFTVGVVAVRAGLGSERNAEHFLFDGTLSKEVVHKSGNTGCSIDGVGGEINRSKPNDTINSSEALSGRSDTDGLSGDSGATESNGIGVLLTAEGTASVAHGNGSAGVLGGGSSLVFGGGTNPEVRRTGVDDKVEGLGSDLNLSDVAVDLVDDGGSAIGAGIVGLEVGDLGGVVTGEAGLILGDDVSQGTTSELSKLQGGKGLSAKGSSTGKCEDGCNESSFKSDANHGVQG